VDWSFEEWATIIWSDECSVERGAGARRTWVWRTPSQKWDKEMIDTYKKGKDISVMVWGAIWVGGRSDLYIMDRDEASKKNGYSANSYVEVLEDQLPTIWSPGMLFMQDNASIHTAKVVKDWFENSGIPVLDWPPYSPDLNPIKIVWAWLKEWITTNYPDLITMGTSEAAYQRLYQAMREGWESIPQEKIDHLIKTMDSRVEACRLAKGWHTRF
jgi:transposase